MIHNNNKEKTSVTQVAPFLSLPSSAPAVRRVERRRGGAGIFSRSFLARSRVSGLYSVPPSFHRLSGPLSFRSLILSSPSSHLSDLAVLSPSLPPIGPAILASRAQDTADDTREDCSRASVLGSPKSDSPRELGPHRRTASLDEPASSAACLVRKRLDRCPEAPEQPPCAWPSSRAAIPAARLCRPRHIRLHPLSLPPLTHNKSACRETHVKLDWRAAPLVGAAEVDPEPYLSTEHERKHEGSTRRRARALTAGVG